MSNDKIVNDSGYLFELDSKDNLMSIRTLESVAGPPRVFNGRPNESTQELLLRAEAEGFFAKVAADDIVERMKEEDHTFCRQEWNPLDKPKRAKELTEKWSAVIQNASPDASLEALEIIESLPMSTRIWVPEGLLEVSSIENAKNGGKYSQADGVKDCRYGIRYVATAPSKDGLIKIGTPVQIDYRLNRGTFSSDVPVDEYTLWGVMRVGNKRYKHQRNDVRHFRGSDGYREVLKALEGVEVILDKRWAREHIDQLLEEIRSYEEDYELKPTSDFEGA
jgi:hypothetical protein